MKYYEIWSPDQSFSESDFFLPQKIFVSIKTETMEAPPHYHSTIKSLFRSDDADNKKRQRISAYIRNSLNHFNNSYLTIYMYYDRIKIIKDNFQFTITIRNHQNHIYFEYFSRDQFSINHLNDISLTNIIDFYNKLIDEKMLKKNSCILL